MSKTLSQSLLDWQAVAVNLRRKPVCWRGTPLSERDTATFTEAIVMCGIHLTDISNQFDGIGTYRENVAWTHFVCSLDVDAVGSFLSAAITELRHVAAPMTIGQFKRCLSQEYPFVGGFLMPIRGALQNFLEQPSSRGFRPCYQFLSFLTHLSLKDLAIDLEGEYEDMEHYVHSLTYPPAYIEEMNAIMTEWMSDFAVTADNFDPQHGPGGSAEVPRSALTEEKFQYLGTDPLIDAVFWEHARLRVVDYFPLPPCPREWTWYSWKREAHVVFVPKSMKTRRVIAKEPVALMYLQQGILGTIDRYICDHPILGRHISLHKQELNGILAVKSSGHRKFTTIDLSSASDTVSLKLVEAVFHGTPLLPFLVALRSETVLLPSGKVLSTAKYAPMGSALCFPVETLIFACAVELAVRRAFREGLGFHPAYRVYGDDIIVSSALHEDVLRILTSLGFITNESKSFGPDERFRESCGHEGYDGVEVTPLKISRKFESPPDRWASDHAACYTGLMNLANDCEVYHFRMLRAWIIGVLLQRSTAPPLFSEDGRGCVYSSTPDNYRARWRLSPDNKWGWYHREEILTMRTTTRPRKGYVRRSDDVNRLWMTLRLLSKRDRDTLPEDDLITVPSSPSVNLLSECWVVLPVGRLSVAELKSRLSDNHGGEVASPR